MCSIQISVSIFKNCNQPHSSFYRDIMIVPLSILSLSYIQQIPVVNGTFHANRHILFPHAPDFLINLLPNNTVLLGRGYIHFYYAKNISGAYA